jgi:hypothetical protein
MKNDGKVRGCNDCGRNAYKILVGKSDEKNHLDVLAVDVRIVLKLS